MKSRHASEAPNTIPDEARRSPLAGELIDLYIAILIVIPLALFLKSLWP
jgi:hypothetical protein